MAPVSKRTRSKNATIFCSLPLDRSSSSRSRRGKRTTSENDNRRKSVVAQPDFAILEDGRELGSGSGTSSSKRKREPFVLDKNTEVIHIGLSSDDDIDDDNDDDGDGDGEERLDDDDVNEERVDVEEGDESDEEGKGNDEFVDKGENFGGGGGDDDCGWEPTNPITISESDEEDESGGSDDDDENPVSSSTDSEDTETSDEDFEVDDDDEDEENGSSSSDDSDSSYDSDSSDDDERGEEEEKKKKKKKKKKKDWRKYNKVVEEMLRKGKIESSGNHTTERKYKQEKEEEIENSPSPSLVNNDECSVQDQEKWKDADDYASASVSSSSFQKKGSFEKNGSFEMKGCCSSSKVYEAAEKQEAKRVKIEVENVSDGDDDDDVVMWPSKDEAQKDKVKKKRNSLRGQKSEPVVEEAGDSIKVQKIKRNNANDRVSFDSHKGKKHNGSGFGGVRNGSSFRSTHLRLNVMLAEYYWGNKSSMKAESIGVKEKDVGGDVHKVDTRPRACGERLPSIWSLEEKAEPLKRSKSEEELDNLWEELDAHLKQEEIDSLIGNIGTKEATQENSICKHNVILDEEIGLYCTWCGFVFTEIKYISPPVVDRFPYEGLGKRASFGGVNGSLFDESQFNVSGSDSDAVFSQKGTVWDLIPDVKDSLFSHQQEGFEFIWKNLAGNINLQKLKSADPCSEGGCIISHAPGTGKTRLTIVFLQTYLKVFPKCLPVVIAPASLLLTWEEEFKKWNIGVPFHNLNNIELSSKEHRDASDCVDTSVNQQLSTADTRMVKLCSWLKEKSILGISYNLYEKLAGGKSQGMMEKVLREAPGLLVLDEGHTPRNQRSLIWKVLTKIQAQKRIILSGTPFQNNFVELYNTLRLVKPSFPDMIPPELKKFCQNRLMQEKKASKEWTWEPISSGDATGNPSDRMIKQLKSLMDPFVHVHKGGILQKSLPGLSDRVLALKPDSLQKGVLESIEGSQNTLNFERKLALVSVHPSLFLCCKQLTKKEESVIDMVQLEELRSNPYGGVKTRFLVEFVRLCDAVNEKVLVFSQFIDPLLLIIEQLKKAFNWSEGKEVLFLRGQLDPKYRQGLIGTFNEAKSEAKIMLASTKACSEGINLVGASRVVLLDVVWNPSVERQAISRAYRLGQKRVVFTYHLITEGTTEWTKYRKQAEKDRLSELVFTARVGEDDEPKSSAVDFEDVVLDKMVQHAKLKDMFAECVVQPKERDLFGGFGF